GINDRSASIQKQPDQTSAKEKLIFSNPRQPFDRSDSTQKPAVLLFRSQESAVHSASPLL
ncbi:MAG: hypothetical protein ACK44Z_05270, partial [Pirellulaceae bacterium]